MVLTCNNCNELADDCTCFDEDENAHAILAYRLRKGLVTSRFLEPKVK